MPKKGLSDADYIKSIKAEMKISPSETGAAVRNKMVKLQNLLGTINEMLDNAQILAKNQKTRFENVKDIAVVEVVKQHPNRKLTAILLEKMSSLIEIKYDGEKTTVIGEKNTLTLLENDVVKAKSLHEQCVSAISVLRSALSYDKAEVQSFGA